MRRNLMFVTYQNQNFDDGLTYAIDLAKTLGKGLSVLLLEEKKGGMERLSDIMAASAFAEACEPTVAIEIAGGTRPTQKEVDENTSRIVRKCQMSGVEITVKTTALDILAAIKDSLRQASDIDMVLLGPTVTESKRVTARELNRLVKSATKPVVTIARQAASVA
jgi:hypothetical protein